MKATAARAPTRRAAERVAASRGVMEAIKMAPALAESAADHGSTDEGLEMLIARRASDPLPAYLAIGALSSDPSTRASRLLTSLLADPDPATRQHAAWAMSRRRPIPAALGALVSMMNEGGFATMMAELALETWLREQPDMAWRAEGAATDRLLWLAERARPQPPPPRRHGVGLRIAQVLMQGRVDAGLTSAASGDGGGLVTLQVGLTRELANHESVDDAYLVTRAIHGESPTLIEPVEKVGSGHIIRLDFGPRRYLTKHELWAHRADLERELERFLVEDGPFDILHLRFADVGTFSAARVARRLEIPIVFTLAPDPHSVIAAAEEDGGLTRSNFAEWEAREHFLFRAWLVDQMLSDAERLALLPRPGQRELFAELMGVDVASSDRFVVVAEGIDPRVADRASSRVRGLSANEPEPSVVTDLVSPIASMPAHRQQLPILLSAGRLSPIKGLDRVVRAWADDPTIHESFNLVLVGGNIHDPSEEEQAVLSAIESGAKGRPGLVLLGGRSHEDVAILMAVARHGLPGRVAPDGIYVSGSAKEEFGLALVEALGAGLPVIAPQQGGPSSYVEHGFTGYLADTLDILDLRQGMRWATGTRSSEVRAEYAQRMVRARYSLSTMASGLADMYATDLGRATAS